MNRKLDADLYQFADDGTNKKDEILKKIMQKVNSPVKSKIRYGKYVIIAVSICLIVMVIGNFNVIASSINKIIDTFQPDESIMINQVKTNKLQDMVEAIGLGKAPLPDRNSIEYQVMRWYFEPIETPCYIYLYFNRGFLEAVVLDEKTDNLDEINEWLKDNAGIVGMVTDTPEEAAQLLSDAPLYGRSKIDYQYSDIKKYMGDDCMLPDYLPDGRIKDPRVNYIDCIPSVLIKYTYEGLADFENFHPVNGTNNFIILEITNINNSKFGKNILLNLAVTKDVKITQINGWDVYISDGYYAWKANDFVYVLYSACTTHEENIKIIKNMK